MPLAVLFKLRLHTYWIHASLCIPLPQLRISLVRCGSTMVTGFQTMTQKATYHLRTCTPQSPFYEHISNFSNQLVNPDVNSHESYVLLCSGPTKLTLHRLVIPSCGLFTRFLGMNPSIVMENQVATPVITLLTLRR